MTQDELLNGLRSFRSAAVVSITARTVPAMRKEDNPFFGRVVKDAHVNGMIRWDYQTAVNRQRVREDRTPDFEEMPRQWGERVRGTPLVEHNGLHYLEVKVQKAHSTYHLDDGTEVPYEDVRPFLKPPGRHRQGVDDPVILRDYRLDHITSIIWHGRQQEVQ
jgi:hypothetical protein